MGLGWLLISQQNGRQTGNGRSMYNPGIFIHLKQRKLGCRGFKKKRTRRKTNVRGLGLVDDERRRQPNPISKHLVSIVIFDEREHRATCLFPRRPSLFLI